MIIGVAVSPVAFLSGRLARRGLGLKGFLVFDYGDDVFKAGCQGDELHAVMLYSYRILWDTWNLGIACRDQQPESGRLPLSKTDANYSDVVDYISGLAANIQRGLFESRDLLKNDDLFGRLSLANDFPASVAGVHAPCFVTAIRRLARSRYEDFQFICDYSAGSGIVEHPGYPALDLDVIQSNTERVLRLLSRHPEIELSRAQMQLYKEYQRVLGRVPDSRLLLQPQSTSSGPVTRAGSQNDNIVRLSRTGDSPEQIAERLDEPIKRVNQVLKKYQNAP